MWIVTLASVLVAGAALSAGFKNKVVEMDLDLMKLHSVCPVETGEDVDQNRIPEIIKKITCGPSLNPICSDKPTACCDQIYHRFQTQCVNVIDYMLVRYKNRGDDFKLYKYKVHVGCNCLVRESQQAIEDRSGAHRNVSNIDFTL